MRRAFTAGVVCSAILLAGCTSTKGELRSHLRGYGMNKDEARCVAEELDDSLTKREMKSINRILSATRDDRPARPSRVVSAVQSLEDPRVLRAVTVANAGCLLLN